MITGTINGIQVEVQQKLHFIANESGLRLFSDGEKLYEVYQDSSGFSDGNWLNEIAVEIESGRARIVRERFGSVAQKSGSSTTVKTVKAPMPGLVKQLLVEEGTSVDKSTPIIILEAMKMENVILAGSEGILAKLDLTVGQAVEKGEALCQINP